MRSWRVTETCRDVFRSVFLAEARLSDYDVEDPRELALPLPSARWRALCDTLDAWPEQSAAERCRLVLVLRALCFYRLIANLIPERGESVRLDRADSALPSVAMLRR
jgi:hypothetical protein